MQSEQPAAITVAPPPSRFAIVRSIPAMGRKHYYCAGVIGNGFRWPDENTRVLIVEKPAVYAPGSLPTEISPADLVALRADKRIAVQVIDGEGGDPAEVVELAARLAKAEAGAAEARAELAAATEQLKLLGERATFAEQSAKEAGERMAQQDAQLADLTAKLAGRKK